MKRRMHRYLPAGMYGPRYGILRLDRMLLFLGLLIAACLRVLASGWALHRAASGGCISIRLSATEP